MTKSEFKILADTIKTVYPRDNVMPNIEAAQMWYGFLKDLDYAPVVAGLQKWIATEKWPPTIADIRDMAAEASNGKIPDWGEAWGQVVRAIHRYGSYRAPEALASMSPQTAATVRCIGWDAICFSEEPETMRAQFRQMYELRADREQTDRQIPQALKETLIKLQLAANSTPQLKE